jgi:hypothetical protein
MSWRRLAAPQAAIVNLDEYEEFQRRQEGREAFFGWLETAVERSAERNVGLSDEQVLAIIERTRGEVASGAE